MIAWLATGRMRWRGAPVLVTLLGATMCVAAFLDIRTRAPFEHVLRSLFVGVGYVLWAAAPLLAKVEAPRLVRVLPRGDGIVVGEIEIVAADVIGFVAVPAVRGWTVAIELGGGPFALRSRRLRPSFFLEVSTRRDATWLAERLAVTFPKDGAVSVRIPRAWLPRASLWSLAIGAIGIVLLLLAFGDVIANAWALAAVPSALIGLLGTASLVLEPLVALRLTWSVSGARASPDDAWTRAKLEPASSSTFDVRLGARSFRIDPSARVHRLAIWQAVHPDTPEEKDGLADLVRVRREPGEPLAAWLSKLDALAGEAYRSAAPAIDDLWRTLASDDATCEARIASARLLRRVYGAEPSEIESHVDDEAILARVRFALRDTPSQAAAALERLGPLVLL